MPNVVSVYCSGSIRKDSVDDGRLRWTDTERRAVAEGAAPNVVVFLNPDDPITDPDNKLGQFGRDMYQVRMACAVIVDARQRRGLGVGVEIAAAAAFGTPVIVVAGPNTTYRRDCLEYRGATVRDYVHPHIASLSTAIVDDFLIAGHILASLPKRQPPNAIGRAHEWLEQALTEYQKNVLPHDDPMRDALRRLNVATVEARPQDDRAAS